MATYLTGYATRDGNNPDFIGTMTEDLAGWKCREAKLSELYQKYKSSLIGLKRRKWNP
jgi:hypothetical protein